MKNKDISSHLEHFKIEELEPRLEMGKWSAVAKSEQNWSTGTNTVQVGARYTF
ncbi:MAG: hypothetical protein ACOCWG_02435 [bacterium]